MVFSSIPFIFFFFILFLLIYYLVPQKVKNIILLIFSVIFYAWGEPIYVLLLIISSYLGYFIGKKLETNNNKKRKIYLIISVIVNLLILGFFKYADFLINIFNSIFKTNINNLDLSLPIGISFFTFQIMSYVIDVYRKEVPVEKSFLDFMTYVSMFPQLIAGPIVRYETISKELHNREITFHKFSEGLLRFLRGLFKKVLIANNVGLLFTTITASNNISTGLAWVGAIAYTLQIYFDFSGYSDMAIGMGKMLGFEYLENFNYPYIATSITDFWRRWHISLSTWFKDYLYIPLGGNRCSKFKHIRNILIVWCLTGLWHGANYNFIIWGLYYGILLLLEKYVLKDILEKCPNIVKHIYTLFFVVIGWVIFAFDDTSSLINYFKALFNIGNIPLSNIENLYYLKNYFMIILIGIVFSIPVVDKLNKMKGYNIIKIFIYIILFIVTIAYLVSDTYNPFLYFRF